VKAVLRRAASAGVMLGLLAVIVVGLLPDGDLPTADQRVEKIASAIRCPACGGASIADATSSVARDLLVVIREHVDAGRSDDDIYDYFVSRYSAAALLSPPTRGWGLWLWLLPIAGMVVGVVTVLRSRRGAAPEAAEDDSGELEARHVSGETERGERVRGLRRAAARDGSGAGRSAALPGRVARRRRTDVAPATRATGPGVWVFAVVAIVAVGVGVLFSARFGNDPQVVVASPLIGSPAPAVPVPLLDVPATIDLGDLRGDITVVNFWASWCTGCRLEHPGLVEAAAAFRDFDVRFVGVLYQDDAADGIRFLDEFGRGDPFLYVFDGDSRVGLEYGVLGLPETFFVDSGGTIVGKISGPAPRDLLLATVERLVAGDGIGEIEAGTVENR
jgi:cytochrome c biogenesis protein CcmG/thiol:disulfide interchange protein DsbE